MQPTIDLSAYGAFLEYESEATWPVVRLKWQDYPEAFASFLRQLTKDSEEISRIDIGCLRMR